MRHLDLFSGIGGFALAARWVGWETIGFCEIDPWCRNVIEKNFDSVCWVSVSGPISSRETDRAERTTELIGLEPDWLVIENVYHTWRQWMPELRRALWGKGYASLPLRVSAAELGCRHVRARGFIIANTDSDKLRQLSWWWSWQGRQKAQELAKSWDFTPRGLGTDNGIPNRVDRLRGLGNAIVPQVAQVIFEAIDEL